MSTPMFKKRILEGPRVRLEPLAKEHHAGLSDAIADGKLWKIKLTLVPELEGVSQFIDNAEEAYQQGRELAFATIDKASGKIVGSTRFREINARFNRVEIGFTFISVSWQRTYINTEAKHLMLKHAFENIKVNRVEFLTDVLNDKSRNAIVRIGATFEGILRAHMQMMDGRIRDSAVFSIIRSEWPEIKSKLSLY